MITLLLLGAASAASPALPHPNEAQPTTAPAVSTETGSISGKAVWEGEMPKPLPPIQPKEKEMQGCAHVTDAGIDTADRSLLIDEKTKGIANVVFTLELEGEKAPTPDAPIELDQHGCRFEPHVIVVPVGATLRYANSDETNHNIHTYSRKNTNINNNVGAESNLDTVLDKSETFEVKCDIHPWMKGYIIVTDAARWGVTGPDGSFELKDVPPGKYKLSYWHETLGKGKTEEVEVTAGQAANLEVKLSAKEEGGKRRRRH